MTDSVPQVLLIEADPRRVEQFTRMLRRIDFPPVVLVHADRLAAGLERLTEGGIDLLFLDLSLPDSQGLDTLRSAQAHAPTVPIVVVCEDEDGTLFHEVLQEGAQDCLGMKTLNASLLAHVIRHVGERQRLQAERQSRTRPGAVSDARLLSIIEQNADAIIVTGREGVVLMANPAACVLIGCRREELVGQVFGFPVVGGEKTEVDILHRGGGLAIAEMRVVEIEWNGEPAHIASLRDITERKQVEGRERLARQILELLNRSGAAEETIRDITLEIRKTTGIDAVGVRLREGDDFPYYVTNGFSEEFLRVERSLCAHDPAGALVRDGQGNPVLECMCGNILCGRTDPTQPFFTTGGSFWTNGTTVLLASTTEQDRQAPTRNRCNREGYESVALIPLRSGSEIIGLLQLNDRRPDRFTEESIRSFESLSASIGVALARQRSLAEIEGLARFPSENPNPILRVREDGRVLYANAASAGLLHLWATAIGDRMPPEWVASVRKALETGQQDIIEVSCGDRVYSLALAPIREAHYVNLYGRDITAQKRLEADRLHLEAQLRQQQKLEAIGTLAGGVAHEINNPITGIMNYAQLIADTAAPDTPAAGHAREIIAETERVATIVRNLLYFARHEKQAHSPAQLADLVEQTLTLLRAVLRRDQIALTVDVPADLPALKCRSQQIQQVLMNLLTNARDALNEKYPSYHPDKTLQVRAQLRDHDGRRWLRVTVADHGPGIPAAIQARIFDPFFTTKPREKGTGLGLSISHGIVQEHHGVLHYETEVGTGTQFHLDLPVDNGWTVEGDTQETGGIDRK